MSKLLLVLAFGLAAPLRLAAQNVPNTAVESQTEEPQRQKKLQKEIRKQTKKAQEEAPLVGAGERTVTYDEVLQDPDNIDLNYMYARTQVRNGNLRSAAATLERILLVNPELPRIRLFYAVVLFRLDNLEEAQKEIDTLKKEKMPESLRDELASISRQIHRRRSKTHVNVSLGAGLDFNNNQNAAPSSKQNLVTVGGVDQVVQLGASSTRKQDVVKTMTAAVGAVRDLGYQAGHQLFLNTNYFRTEQTTVRIFNIQNYSAQLGAAYVSPWGLITPSLELDHLILAQTTYERSLTPKLQFDRPLSARLDVSAEANYARQVYNRTAVVPTGDQRTGDKVEGGATLGVVLTPTMKINVGFTHIDQGASVPWFAYRRESFTFRHTWVLPRGQFLLSSLVGNYDRYKGPELDLSNKNRLDDTYRASATYGLPVGIIVNALRDFSWTFSYEYYHALSSLKNYAYSSNKASTMLTYKFDFAL